MLTPSPLSWAPRPGDGLGELCSRPTTCCGWRVLRVAGVAALLATACSTRSPEPQAPVGPSLAGAELLRCDESDQVDPGADAQVLAEGVVVAKQFEADATRQGNGLLFAKGGLWARGTANLRLTVTSPTDALMGWGKPGTPARQVVVPRCGGSQWRVWPGGLYVDEAGTVSLIAESAEHKDTVALVVRSPVIGG
jgi:hypothetical protein